MKNIKNIIRSIVVLTGIAMLLSCENSILEVQSITSQEKAPESSGEEVEFIFTDSTRIKYRAFAVEFIEIKTEDADYQEFQKGGKIISYDDDGTVAGQIEANYAKHFVSNQLWELRNKVVAVSDDGNTINTELMYWDQNKGLIYSDQYVRIIDKDGQVLEGDSFTSDDKMNNIILKNVTGEVYLNDESQQ
ncbi:LPS export ABC transporter periplasmic protein LptC [Labilibaculum antarcticum]|uniref:LPS export ABC transporter periplasmic protein LptC n=1 Tax=Labilibaculum antarcticum TaxID=1717717 RepID=A0A1Y1CK25_9BACT|nr:LPS export ABC transporter periplasmic protein LptC [Labilibaculum antarcticum]BAX80630.1 LPS export ABC transporter periplasmic protein LptC [Labilibaculum antarcticum]